MSITLEALKTVKAGDAIYRTTRPLIVQSVEHPGDSDTGVLQSVMRVRNGRYIETYTLSEYTAARIRRIVPKEKRRKPHSRRAYEFANSDGGRRVESFAHETNDCTVRALALVTGASYADAHAHMKAHGRKDRRGVHVMRPYLASTLGAMTCERINCPDTYRARAGRQFGRSLGQWLKSPELPARCILVTRNHAIAVVDGRVLDTFKTGTRGRVIYAYAFRPASTVSIHGPQMPVDAPAASQVSDTPAASNGRGVDAAREMAAALASLLQAVARQSHENTDATNDAFDAADAALDAYMATTTPATSNGRGVDAVTVPGVDISRITEADSARHVWHVSRAGTGAFIGFVEQFAAAPGETHPFKAFPLDYARKAHMAGVYYGGPGAFRRAVSTVAGYLNR